MAVLWQRELGLRDYEPVWRAMQTFTEERNEQTVDELWFLQHEPVFTLGQAGKTEHILNPGNIPVVKIDRGGQVTYHGPGQLVVYLLLDIKRRKLGVRQLVDAIEQSIVALLASYDIEAELRPGAPGVYVDGNKIASLGLRIRKGCSYHGLSLNIEGTAEAFQRINPCGYEGLQVADLGKLLGRAQENLLPELKPRLAEILRAQLQYDELQPAANTLPYL
jgi:lipoyl(octanoyl) transferase